MLNMPTPEIGHRIHQKGSIPGRYSTADSKKLEYGFRVIHAGYPFPWFWDQRTAIFQLSAFCCSAVVHNREKHVQVQ